MQTLDEWLSWQETLHPEEIELGLERIRDVAVRMDLLNPEARVVTVAGTNGKGSSVALLESITRSAGLKVGVYTSPHLLRYNERIRVDGELVSDEQLCAAFEAINRAREETSLTYFEFGTLAAFYLFRQYSLDLWILEVGLGGRLDAVNLVNADVALLTTVDLDHQAWLGETREEIGYEKAGIFRAGHPAVVGELAPPQSVLEHAAQIGTPLLRAGHDFGFEQTASAWSWRGYGETLLEALPMPALQGDIQLHNSAAVLEVIAQLGWLEYIGSAAIHKGLSAAYLPGRFETIATEPQVIVDVSHNPQAAAVLADNLQAAPCSGETWAVVGMLHDKEVGRVITTLAPQIDHWLVAGLEGHRGLNSDQLAAQIESVTGKPPERKEESVVALFQQVQQQVAPVDRILVFGSFYTVAAVLPAP